jgi:hypothetical protein
MQHLVSHQILNGKNLKGSVKRKTCILVFDRHDTVLPYSKRFEEIQFSPVMDGNVAMFWDGFPARAA